MGSVSDEVRRKRFFALRPQNDKRRKRISQSVILSVSEESFHSAQIRIFCIRHCEAPQGAVAIRFLCIAHLLQICGFAGLFIVLSFISGTPLSLLVQRKLQRKHTKAGRRKSPRLAIHPSARRWSFLLIIRCRAERRSARAPIEMFRSGNTGSVSDEMTGNPIL